MTTRILVGDVRARLADLPDDHFDCVLTSPPYWGLRSYLDPDHPNKHLEIGCEPTLGEHLEVIVGVMEQVRRVLKPTGVCWVNYGDCYATSPNGRSAAATKATGSDDRTFRDKPFSTVGPIQARSNGGEGSHHNRRGSYLKPKDLCLVPQRLAIALQEKGWWVRSLMPWVKRNSMPESISDRPASSIEYIIMLTKSERYPERELVREHVQRLLDLAEAYRIAGPQYSEPRTRVVRLAKVLSRLAGIEKAPEPEQPSLIAEVAT